ncbi:gamma-glutamyltransferase family protein [Natronobacterium gregoryi]|uniref:Gamma-glutamyltransferase n=2 Tax=Natronobacterium gregoryi TaxID=44930 RepID=L0ALV9_NATGS|nr:gamma-glutamyltransferase [Natronobacterium gregoryi]AFZ74781.1 gamma-glutamyltransferase [Natronobacterium gregoryi SP2]ELY73546.1 gamma-glutamyltransferase [Natronobacterium gregoryi SP2]PLK19426.1 gamma-glutamyltransferase [Natronobacterium gregoryi SP2]SFJ49289.1 gamma-glutamyltranspeptidase / glutathione hydrolase [Natronobacterium gregoryi]
MVPTLNRRELLLGSGGVGIAAIAGDTRPETNAAGADDPSDDSVAVVSQHHLATEAGLEILEQGGTAADAAVAVACTLSVVEPWFSSVLGGGTWALYYEADSEEVTSVDGVGPVGSDATVDDFEDRAGDYGMHQSIVPGAWDGWMLWLEEYGELDLAEVVDPAMTIAREGYPASPGMIRWLGRRADRIEERPDAVEIYMPDGELVEEGETSYQYDMADTFEALSDAYTDRRDEGRNEAIQAARDYFYRGPIAEAIVEFSDENDGYLTRPDFEEFEADIVDPISIEYDEDLEVYQNPPNSQGITQLLALNVLEAYDLDEIDPDSADAVHVQAEAIKLAFADRYHHVGDPDRVDVPVADLLDEEYAADQRDRFEMDDAMEWPIDSGLSETDADHTTTFHVVDADGNGAAVTTSLGAQFQVIGDTGIHLNNRMRMLSLEEDDPNRLTPGYKVRHTSNPYLATCDGEPYVLGGNTGVDMQPQGQTQQFVNVAEFGLGAQEAIDSPRFETTAFPSTQHPYDIGNTLEMEREFPDDIVEELEERGHDVDLGGSYGTANMIVVDEDGDLEVGAESRSETADGNVVQLED